MNPKNITYSRLVLPLLFVFFISLPAASFATTYYSRATGNWDAAATWSTASCGGAAAGAFPVAGDDVYICAGHTITIQSSRAEQCTSLTITSDGSNDAILTLTSSGACSLTVSGALTMTYTGTPKKKSTININTTNTLTVGGTSWIEGVKSGGNNSISQVVINGGNYIATGAVTLTSGGASAKALITFAGSDVLKLGAAGTAITFSGAGATINNTAAGGGTAGTIEYNNAGGQTIELATTVYYNLILSGGGTKTAGATATINGTLTVRAGVTLSISTGKTLTSTTTILETVGGGTGSIVTGAGTGTFKLAGGVTVNYTGAGAITTGATISTPGGLDLNGANRTFTVNDDGTSTTADLIISVATATGNSDALTKAGAGSLTLSGANAHKGGTTLSAGILNINHATALGGVFGGSQFTIAGGTSIDNTSGAAITNSNNNGQTWNGDFTFIGSNALDMGTGAVTTAATRVITVTSSTLTEGGLIGAGTAIGVTKAGAGVLTLSGLNTYTGATTVNGGTLKAGVATTGANGAFGNKSAVTLANTAGVILDITGFNNTIGSLATGGATGGNVTLGSATLTTGGDNSNTTYDGIISGTGAVTKAGTGTWTVGGANTYSGLTTISAGVFKLGAAGNATNTPLGTTGAATSVTSGAALDLGGFTLGTAEALTLNGTGVTASPNGALTNSTGSPTYSGAITLGAAATVVNDGTLLTLTGGVTTAGFIITVSGTGNTTFSTAAIAGTGGVTKAGTGIATMSFANTYTGATAVNSGTLQAGVVTSAFGNNSAVTMANTAGAVLDITGFDNTIGSLATGGATGGNVTLGSATLTTGGNNTSTTYSGIISGTGAVTKAGTGTWTVGGANTYSGLTTISAGTFKLGATGDATNTPLGTTGAATSVTSGAAIDLGGFTLGTAEAITLNGTGIAAAGAMFNSGAACTYSGLITLGSASSIIGGTGTIAISNTGTITGSGFALTLGGAQGGSIASIIGTNAGTLTKQNAGTWTLSGLNTYTGATTVNGGTLQAGVATTGSNGAFGNLSSVTLANTAGVVLDLNSFNNTIGSLATGGATGGNVTLGSATLTTGGNNTSTTYSGVISGTGAITKDGTGTWTVGGSNSYSGLTTISAGVFKLGATGDATNSPLGTTGGATSVTSGAALDLAGFTLATSEALTLNGTGIASAGALFNSGAACTYSGLITLGSASSIIGGTGTINISNAGTISGAGNNLTLGGAQGGTLASILGTGTGTLTKQDAGTWTLSGANTFSGGTTLSVGQLNINNASGLGTGAFSIANGTTIDNTSGGAISNSNTNALTLNGNFTFTGSNDLNLGTGTITMGSDLQITTTAIGKTLTLGGTNNNGTYNLTKQGSGILAFGSNDVTINNLTISAGSVTSTSGNLTLMGNYSYSAGTFTHNNGTVIFNGSAAQTIGTSGTQAFYNLTVNNSGGSTVTLNTPVTVSNALSLSAGYLVTTSVNSILVTNTSGAAVNGGSATSYVKGPITWSVTTGQTYTFPTGKGTTWARSGLSSVDADGAFTAEYFNTPYSSIGSADLSTVITPTLVTLSGIEYWDVARTSGTANAAVTLYWENASASKITDCSKLRVAHYTGGKWQNEGGSGSGSCSGTGSGSVTGGVQTTFSPETFGSSDHDNVYNINPLPIELLYFSATFNGKGVSLNWETASEINNDYFTLERSTDGVNFTEISKVNSKAINGTSTSVLSYTAIDVSATNGTFYYRLKQTDFDGKFSYSNVKVITLTSENGSTLNFSIAPNPNNGRQMDVIFSAATNTKVIVTILNVLGEVIYTTTVTSNNNEGISHLPINFGEPLKAGVYFISGTSENGQTQSEKVIVQ